MRFVCRTLMTDGVVRDRCVELDDLVAGEVVGVGFIFVEGWILICFLFCIRLLAAVLSSALIDNASFMILMMMTSLANLDMTACQR